MPSTDDFTVKAEGKKADLSSVEVSTDTAILELESAVEAEEVTIDYDSKKAKDPIRNPAENEASGLSGRSVTNETKDPTAPTISNVSLRNDGSDNLALRFESNEHLKSIGVTVDGPNTTDIYSFDETDSAPSGNAPCR